MVKVWTLFLCLLSPLAYGYNFKYIKLDKQFEDYLRRVNQPTAAHGLMQKSSVDNTMEIRMRKALLGATYLENTAKAKSMAFSPTPSGEPPLYEEIREHLQQSHTQIGIDEVTRIDRINRQYNMGKENFSGFSWQKPFGSVQIHVDRQVTPNLETENANDAYLVQDTFTFYIEATSYLESLRQANFAKMSASEIGAFAGITFKRVYSYDHYAPTYQAGLQADFSKLFLPFLRFHQAGIEGLGAREIVKREDVFTAKAGGLISTPPIYNVSFSAGVLAEADLEQRTSIQALVPDASDPKRFLVGVRRKASKKAGAVLQLQLDFFNILKLTLVRAEMSYQYTEGKEFTLGFTTADWQQAMRDELEGAELRTLLKGFTDIKSLERYVIRLDETQSESIEAYGNVLLWGRLGKSKTETQRIIKDGQVHVFYKTFMQQTKTVQSLLSRVISEFLYHLLKLPIGTKDEAIYEKKIAMEYRDNHPQASNPAIQRAKTAEEFSFEISRSYEASGRKGKLSSQYKNEVAWFLGEFTTLPKNYQTDIKSDKLRPPVRVDSKIRVEAAGFKYFVKLTPKEIFGTLVRVCKSSKLKEWQDDVERVRMLNANQGTGPDACVKKIGLEYVGFKEDYDAYYQMPSLFRLRAFLMDYVNAIETNNDLMAIFGSDNVFYNGEINAHFAKGGNFRDVFSRGQFRGYGVIDNFKRANGTRTPASITSE